MVPLGGQNITRDLCSLQLDEQEAERIKRKYGVLYPAASDETVQVDDERTIELRKVHEVIEARLEEILLNVVRQVETGQL